MNKTLIWVLSLTAVGVAAYFVFKPKKVIKGSGGEIIVE